MGNGWRWRGCTPREGDFSLLTLASEKLQQLQH